MSAKKSKGAQALCHDLWPEDGIPYKRPSGRRGGSGRKLGALCKQIEHTVSYVLAGYVRDARLRDLMVRSVMPAPDASRFEVMVYTPDETMENDPKELQERLNALRGLFREHVAQSLHRKRVPDITFRVIHLTEGEQM